MIQTGDVCELQHESQNCNRDRKLNLQSDFKNSVSINLVTFYLYFVGERLFSTSKNYTRETSIFLLYQSFYTTSAQKFIII